MGSGIAESAARAGIGVTLVDADQAALDRSRRQLEESLAQAVRGGKLAAGGVEDVLDRIAHTTDIDDVTDSELVIEAVFEDLAVKTEVFRQLGEVVRPDTVIASNTSSIPIAELAVRGEAKNLAGIGKTIESKIVQIVESGEIEALTKRKARVPAGVAEFLRLPALGPKTARRIWQDLGITTMADLRKAAEAEQLRALPGLGAKTEERILRALAEKPRETRALLAKALRAGRAGVEVIR
jgi:DNA uptake protein ComE-like DNA-binding protein